MNASTMSITRSFMNHYNISAICGHSQRKDNNAGLSCTKGIGGERACNNQTSNPESEPKIYATNNNKCTSGHELWRIKILHVCIMLDVSHHHNVILYSPHSMHTNLHSTTDYSSNPECIWKLL